MFASNEGMSETGIIPPPSIIPRIEIADIINEEFLPITINIHTESVLKKREVIIMQSKFICISAYEKSLLDKKKRRVIRMLNKKIYITFDIMISNGFIFEQNILCKTEGDASLSMNFPHKETEHNIKNAKKQSI